MAKKRIRRGAATWRELLERQRSSGLSVTAFCRREALSRGVFHHWQAKLSAETPMASEPIARAVPAPFVEVGELFGARCTIRLELGEGMVLTIQRG